MEYKNSKGAMNGTIADSISCRDIFLHSNSTLLARWEIRRLQSCLVVLPRIKPRIKGMFFGF